MLSKIFREIAMTDKVYCLCHARVFSSPQQNNYNKVCHTPSTQQVNQITGCGLVSRQCAAVAYDHALVFLSRFQTVHLPKRWKCWQKYKRSCVFQSYPEGKLSVDVRVCLEEKSPSMRESVKKQKKKVLRLIQREFFNCKFLRALRYLHLHFRLTYITLRIIICVRNEGKCFALETACHAWQVKTNRA